ncbi:hypothetical protein E1A91_A06G054100v1 [Gossypium mustelinum]|uniref:Uncharacterized protein n=2 Tax=Gossypium TaxID=3633 RepID=A0ABR0PIW1_GOSAR|nr:uncharacterized protein LOC108475322 [Gossypium arboreum]KAK5824360.1 hypothetical protein PVK06_019131 [Gossypium arboreum]TYJ29192.1 hypothetical protein E1A91_A06G054100v1 [Gossypium mustelinum]
MNHCNLQQNDAVLAYEEMRGLIAVTGHQKGGAVVCPKPRRIGVPAINLNKPWRFHTNHQADVSDSISGVDPLDIILVNKDLGTEQEQSIASTPPYFWGSPPSRSANPLVQDVRFGDERLGHALWTLQTPSLSSSSSAGKGERIKMKFGLTSATVRVEGFDCLNRDGQNSRIPATA